MQKIKLPLFINVAEVARRMGRSKSWLYQRLNGQIVNKKPATFKSEDLEKLGQVLVRVWVELAEVVGLQNITRQDLGIHPILVNILAIEMAKQQLDCIQRFVLAFSFDNGEESITEQASVLNEANRILAANKPPSNCEEVELHGLREIDSTA